MESKRVMGLDIGTKRTGIALSDESQVIASPHDLVIATSKKEWVERIARVVGNHDLETIVVGLPLNQYGEEGQDAENIRSYVALLRERVSVPVVEWDERFTTLQAERALISADVSRKRRKEVVDKVAACILLQSYLDSRSFARSEDFE